MDQNKLSIFGWLPETRTERRTRLVEILLAAAAIMVLWSIVCSFAKEWQHEHGDTKAANQAEAQRNVYGSLGLILLVLAAVI